MTRSPLARKVNDGTLPDAAFFTSNTIPQHKRCCQYKSVNFPTVFFAGAHFVASGSLSALNGHALDLYQCAFGDACCLESGAGGVRLGKELSVHLVHGGKVCNIVQQHRGFYHISHACACSGQNVGNIGQALARLGLDVLPGKFAGSRVNGDLAGNVNGVACLDALGIRANGGRGFIGMQCGVCLLYTSDAADD